MDTLLIVVTALSLAMAIGMGIVVVKLLREERDRSGARVAALTAMAGNPLLRQRETVAPPAPVRPHPEPLGDLELRPAQPGPRASAELFAERDAQSPWGRRLAVIGMLTAVLAAGLFAATLGRGHSSAGAGRAAVPAAAGSAPLELLSLRHSRDAQGLTIAGLVQNPAAGAPSSRLVATAFVFGPDGAFLTSSRAPIDITTLAPGDESPFVVTVPVHGDVSRYRIGFRTEDGRVVAHVDKRTTETLTRKQEQP